MASDRLDTFIVDCLTHDFYDVASWWRHDRKRLQSHVYGAVRALCRIDGVLPLPERDEVVDRLPTVLAEHFGVDITK